MSKLRLSIPALLGALILLLTAPGVLTTLSVESGPVRNLAAIGLLTDCPTIIAEIAVSPAGGDFFAGLSSPNDASISTPDRANAILDEVSQRIYESVVIISIVPVHMGQESGCESIQLDVGNTTSTTSPSLMTSNGASITLEKSFDDDGDENTFGTLYSVVFENRDSAAVLIFDWPDFYTYSHRDSNPVLSALGEFSAALDTYIYWESPNSDKDARGSDEASEPIRAFLDVKVLHPLNFDFNRSTWVPSESHQDFVAYQVDTSTESGSENWVAYDEPPFLTTRNRYRSTNYEGKQNFLLLVGGALIGLGVTLIVETLIAFLFRVRQPLTVLPNTPTTTEQIAVGEVKNVGDGAEETVESNDDSDSRTDAGPPGKGDRDTETSS